ncbi:hypothetical protein [Nocardioides terrisoli]|uniref:hypothetical protein n=1 Tax=Nocardioides terrisoli TaxID=3388267 RepID=UPI00287B5F8F|nr:hypothetical protein [Nocardioides marmorisolisilvae]
MTRLLRVELSRFVSRRAIALLLLAGAVFVGVVAAKTIWDTRPPSSAEIATARAQAQLIAGESQLKAQIASCRQDPARFLGSGATAQDCRDTLAGSAQSLLPRQPLDLRQVLGGSGADVAVGLVALMVLAAATFIGADWASGALTTQLTFAPRRGAVWVAKAMVVLIASAVVTGALLACFWATLWITSDVRDLHQGPHLFHDVAWQWARAVGLAMAAGLGSYALTMFFRHTVATLGLLFAYAAGGEVLVNLIPIAGASRWAIGNNIYAWLNSHFVYADPGVGCGAYSSCDAARHLGHGNAAWFLAVLLAVAVLPSFLSFVRRDVG